MTTVAWKREVLWPGMLALVLSGLVTWFFYITRLGGDTRVWRVVWLGEHSVAVFYLPWLMAMPFVGAITAFFARRNGASPARRLLVATFPALLNLVLFSATTVLILVLHLDRQVTFADKMVGFAALMLPWMLTPALCGMMGAAVFCFGGGAGGRDHSRRATA